MVMAWKMAVAAMSMRLAISACRWPNSWTPSSRPVRAVAGEPHGDAVAAGVVGLVVVGLGLDGDRVVPGGGGLMVAQPGAGGGLVEDLHDLGAEAAGELPVPAEGVLPRDPALLVGGGAERQVGLAEQPVVGDHAVAGSEHVGEIGAHAPVHGDRAPGAQSGPGAGSQGGVGTDTHDDQDHVSLAGSPRCHRRRWPRPGAVPPRRPVRVICRTVVPVRTSTPRSASWAWTSWPSAGSTVGSTSGSCSIWMTCRPRVVRASAISRPMYPAPTMTAVAGAFSSRVRMTANVLPIECSR